MGRLSRRQFLQYAAATAAAAGWASKHARRLISPAEPMPEGQVGHPTIYTTTCRECPAGCGMHVINKDGRATKAEGNRDHPVSRGGLCARGQSSLQGLYDPDRLRSVLHRTQAGQFETSNWDAALEAIAEKLRAGKGRVVLLSDLQNGTLGEVFEAFTAAHGGGKPIYYEPVNYPAVAAAYEMAGGAGIPRFDLSKCKLVISFAADFLETWISPVEFTKGFADLRTWRDNDMGRFLYVGPRQSMTAANADEFWKVKPGNERWVAFALLHEILQGGLMRRNIPLIDEYARRYDIAAAASKCSIPREKLQRLAKLFCQEEPTVALAGPAMADNPAARDLAVAAMLLNAAAGRDGQSVEFNRVHALSKAAPVEKVQQEISSLISDDVLIVHQCNPVYSLPGCEAAIAKAGMVVYLGTMQDETARLAQWALPLDHPLESWGDYEPYTGVHCLIQPTTGRLYDTRLAGDVLLEISRRAGTPLEAAANGLQRGEFLNSLHSHWRKLLLEGGGEKPWVEALKIGTVMGEGMTLRAKLEAPPESIEPAASQPADQLTLWAYPSIFLFDGRYSNRGWLQEAPDPVSYFVWSSSVDLHPDKAAALGVGQGDVVELETSAGKIEVGVRLNFDQHPSLAAIALGQGHTGLGRFADGVGANAFLLKEFFGPLQISKTGRKINLPAATNTMDQQGWPILQWTSAEALTKGEPPEEVIMPLPEGYSKKRDLYPPREYKEHRWAMVVDAHRCIGCGACAVACYAENNISVVGGQKVAKGREMAWLQVLPYYKEKNAGRLGYLPMLCQHCDAAPCEPVCPVFAAVHNEEGLNAQIYNRCVGTRYCSNNCPYKVRRFNWGNPEWPAPLEVQLNPDLSARVRGVMEKCTFCIQRIRAAEYQAKLEHRKVADGEIQPACVQSCPARVYAFGDLLDEKAEVTRIVRNDPRRYQVLKHLNTKSAVIYLKRIAADVVG